eukprot:495504-Prymnesium_polylepis.1
MQLSTNTQRHVRVDDAQLRTRHDLPAGNGRHQSRQPSDASRWLQVAHVCLDGTQCDRRGVDLRERTHFGWITQCSASTNTIGARTRNRKAQKPTLRRAAWRGEAGALAILPDSAAADAGLSISLACATYDESPDAFAANIAVSTGIERLAPTIGGKHTRTRVPDGDMRSEVEAHGGD